MHNLLFLAMYCFLENIGMYSLTSFSHFGKRGHILLFFLMLLNLAVKAQIVNIESRRFQTDTVGWKGSADIGFSMGKQKETYYIISTAAHVQYKSIKHLYLILGNYEILKSKSDNLVNNGFLHFRHNYKLKKEKIRWESFTQVQFNKINGLRMRYLLGSGPRFKLLDKKNYKMYLGTLYMYEYEVNTDKSQKLNECRFSGYLSFNLKPNDIFEFVSTTYYQPNIIVNRDFRVSTENALLIKLHKNFALSMNLRLTYDSRPPIGAVSNLVYIWSNSFKALF